MKKGDEGYIFLTIIKKGRKAINITIIITQSFDNKVTVSNQQDPEVVYFSVLLKNRLCVIQINYLNLFFVGKNHLNLIFESLHLGKRHCLVLWKNFKLLQDFKQRFGSTYPNLLHTYPSPGNCTAINIFHRETQ